MRRDTLCVVAMGRDEHRKVDTFVDHYLAEGATRITLLDDRSVPPLVLAPVHQADPRVKLRRVQSNLTDAELAGAFRRECFAGNTSTTKSLRHFRQLREPNLEAQRFRGFCEWLLYADLDELTYARRDLTLAQALRAPPFADADVIHVPWLIFGVHAEAPARAARELPLEPGPGVVRRWFARHAAAFVTEPDDVVSRLVHRWDYAVPHPHARNWTLGSDRPTFKSLARVASPHFRDICRCPHNPTVDARARCVSGIGGWPMPLYLHGNNLRKPLSEATVSRALLVQHHYRVSSFEDIRRQCAICREELEEDDTRSSAASRRSTPTFAR